MADLSDQSEIHKTTADGSSKDVTPATSDDESSSSSSYGSSSSGSSSSSSSSTSSSSSGSGTCESESSDSGSGTDKSGSGNSDSDESGVGDSSSENQDEDNSATAAASNVSGDVYVPEGAGSRVNVVGNAIVKVPPFPSSDRPVFEIDDELRELIDAARNAEEVKEAVQDDVEDFAEKSKKKALEMFRTRAKAVHSVVDPAFLEEEQQQMEAIFEAKASEIFDSMKNEALAEVEQLAFHEISSQSS